VPELPEVETVRRTLETLVVGKVIRDIDVFFDRMIRTHKVSEFQKILEQRTIQSIDRYGKYLLFNLDDMVLISHLRMEGKYFVKHLDEPKNKHEHVIFYFQDGETLRYHDTRKFGTFDLIKKEDLYKDSPLTKLGIEPTSKDLTVTYLQQKLAHKTIFVKPALLDQTIICGLGNIYVDEVLFHSKLSPLTRCDQLTKKDLERIIAACKVVIDKATALGGSSIRSYTSSLGVTGRFQNELMVHTKQGESCEICSTEIIKIRVGGRGTYYCPTCQKERKKKS